LAALAHGTPAITQNEHQDGCFRTGAHSVDRRVVGP
jgi:hypothetical protein